MLSAENWCLKVDNKVYGPYTTQQMRKFAHEGRLASWSLVSPAGGRSWREARNEMVFSTFFGGAPLGDEAAEHAPAASARPFGKRSGYKFNGAETTTTTPDPKPIKVTTRRAQPEEERGVANFVVIFDVVSGAASRVEAAMLSLGNAFRLADNVWHVSCELTAVGVRNAISPYLRGSESIFVVDASRGHSSWANYAPEAHAKIAATHLKGK